MKKRKGNNVEDMKKSYSNEKRKERKESEGYTFVETLIVLAIGAILACGSTVSASKYISSARQVSARNQIEGFSAALQTYFLDCGRFPTTEQGLEALWEKPVLYPVPENWNGPYLERRPGLDPWKNPFKYISSESSIMPEEVPRNIPYVLISYGADKEEGGTGNDKDIVSWE